MTLRAHLIFALTALLFCGCESAPDIGIDKTIADAKKKFDDMTPSSEEMSEAAEKEVKKLTTIEYRVHTLSLEATPEEMQSALAELGKERWSCFHMERLEKEMLVFCSRRPKSYLRHLTRILPVPLQYE